MTTIAPAERCSHPPLSLLASASTRKLLTRYVARQVRGCDVDDVVQATLCDALASARVPGDVEAFRRWLLAIARFKVVDVHRSAARIVPGDLGEVASPAPPVEALSLMRWAERQLPRGAVNETTLRWMVREAEGDQLEAIASDEAIPADRVRQRVSRLRRWMRERWVAELATVAVVAIVGLLIVARSGGGHETIVPEMDAAAAPIDARLIGTWKLVSFDPATPLPSAQRAIADRLVPSLGVTFDGRALQAAAVGGFVRGYAVTALSAGSVEAVELTDRALRVSATYAWDGDDLVVTVPGGAWAGIARLERVR